MENDLIRASLRRLLHHLEPALLQSPTRSGLVAYHRRSSILEQQLFALVRQGGLGQPTLGRLRVHLQPLARDPQLTMGK